MSQYGLKIIKQFNVLLILCSVGSIANEENKTQKLMEGLSSACESVNSHMRACGFMSIKDAKEFEQKQIEARYSLQNRCKGGSRYDYCVSDRYSRLDDMIMRKNELLEYVKEKEIKRKAKKKLLKDKIMDLEEQLSILQQDPKIIPVNSFKEEEELSLMSALLLMKEETEGLRDSLNFLQKLKEEKEKEAEMLREQQKELSENQEKISESQISEIMKIIGVKIDNLDECQGNTFAEKCISKLKKDAKPYLALAAKVINLRE